MKIKVIRKSERNVTYPRDKKGEKDEDFPLGKTQIEKQKFKKKVRESKNGVCLRIKRTWGKAGKYRKQKSPEKIKTDEHFRATTRRSKPCAIEKKSDRKKETEGKADHGQERKRFQANWKNTEKAVQTVTESFGVETGFERRRVGQ